MAARRATIATTEAATVVAVAATRAGEAASVAASITAAVGTPVAMTATAARVPAIFPGVPVFPLRAALLRVAAAAVLAFVVQATHLASDRGLAAVAEAAFAALTKTAFAAVAKAPFATEAAFTRTAALTRASKAGSTTLCRSAETAAVTPSVTPARLPLATAEPTTRAAGGITAESSARAPLALLRSAIPVIRTSAPRIATATRTANFRSAAAPSVRTSFGTTLRPPARPARVLRLFRPSLLIRRLTFRPFGLGLCQRRPRFADAGAPHGRAARTAGAGRLVAGRFVLVEFDRGHVGTTSEGVERDSGAARDALVSVRAETGRPGHAR